jgi:hypothetical protein
MPPLWRSECTGGAGLLFTQHYKFGTRRFANLCAAVPMSFCGRTVSILPSFAQPYRLVLNATISEFFGGTLGANSLSWLSLLQQYWNRFTKWIPEIDRVIRSVVERSPPHPDAAGWWEVIVAVFGDLEKITGRL